MHYLTLSLATLLLLVSRGMAAAAPPELQRWLTAAQDWQRDTEGPILSLGQAGAFDDTHIFAPAVACEHHSFQLWYCGSTGTVAERVFQLGLATSPDGRIFQRHASNPVFSFGDGRHSVLTPTLLRSADGSTLRDNGRLRMWFSSTWFASDSDRHSLHETFSTDGVHWSPPSPAQLDGVYAPTILKDGSLYRMWYTDVSATTWTIRHASSHDGRNWRADENPCLVVDQDWEQENLFYPTVIKSGDVYLMWYGSYWAGRPNTTALGFAASLDGIAWQKHARNPVLLPDPTRPWESHYVTSQSVLRLSDGSLRIWYASRTQPPFVNKYFAVNTAIWKPRQ